MKTSLSLLLVLGTLLAGCVTKSDDDDDGGDGADDQVGDDTAGDDTAGDDTAGDDTPGDDSPGDDGTPSGAAPAEGTWRYDQITPTSNTCGSQLPVTPSGDYAIVGVTGAGFMVVDGDGTFNCSLDDGSFDCPERAHETMDLRPTYDAVVTIDAQAQGAFSSSTRASGTQTATATCVGSDCAAVAASVGASLPCSAAVGFTTSKR